MKKKSRRTGPRSKNIKDKWGREITFFVNEMGKVSYTTGDPKLGRKANLDFTDAQVRSLRNWLTWYLALK